MECSLQCLGDWSVCFLRSDQFGGGLLRLVRCRRHSLFVAIFRVFRPSDYYRGALLSGSLLAASYRFLYFRGGSYCFYNKYVVVADVRVFDAISSGFTLATMTLQR